MNLFGFGQSATVDVLLHGCENKKYVELRNDDGGKEKLYIYYDGESVGGQVIISLKKGTSKLEHQGIKIEFIGQITLYFDRSNQHEFISIARDLCSPGVLMQSVNFPFEFVQVEKPFESYTGSNVALRYFVRVTINRRMSDIVKEHEIIVHTLSQYPDHIPNSLKMEVGIEDCLHIEFEYNKAKYHIKDVIIGKIYFLLVRIKVKYMELQIVKRESTGHGTSIIHENEIITKFEIMDGAPVKGESIPIRLFLSGHDLTPTFRDINKKFSVRYYINVVLVDEEERRYFKEQEVVLYRKSELKRLPIAPPVLHNLLHQAAQLQGCSSILLVNNNQSIISSKPIAQMTEGSIPTNKQQSQETNQPADQQQDLSASDPTQSASTANSSSPDNYVKIEHHQAAHNTCQSVEQK